MRRILLLVAACLALTACSGVDAQRAQDLLAQASQAQSRVKSSTISMRFWSSIDSQQFSVDLNGGGYAKGPHRGDFYLRGTISGLPLPADSFTVVRRNGAGFFEFGGQRVALPATAQSSSSTSLADFDLARYVVDVKVDEHHMLAGVPVARITGTLDTAALVKGILAQLGPLPAGIETDKLAGSFGNTHAALYVSERSHLVTRALVDVPIKSEGKKIVLHVDYALTRVNRPVVFPG